MKGAWFGESRHPGETCACSTCGARAQAPCVATVGLLGLGQIGTPLRGLHVDRVAAGEVARAKQVRS